MAKRIALVAGEASGDLIGAALIASLKQRYPDAEFYGIAGPQMIRAGCKAYFPSESLSVMGLFEVLAHLKEILTIRNKFFDRLVADPPDVFVGVDAPDFNLPLERRLREKGIKTVHYVSPSVWAWRQKRVFKIKKSVDLMLTLFPFEAAFYEAHGVPVRFVGHPLADIIDMEPDKARARATLGIGDDEQLVALLPGSRRSEVKRLGKIFLQAASRIAAREPGVRFIAPMASDATRAMFRHQWQQTCPDLDITIIEGQSREVMTAADVVLLASGTAALEGLLVKRPMVIAYRLSPLTYWILKTFNILKISTYSLPNLLAGKVIAPEYIQADATPDNLSAAIMQQLKNKDTTAALQQIYHDIHIELRRNASASAANAIAELMEGKA
jgi:lipid-A-disaccharide synthase